MFADFGLKCFLPAMPTTLVRTWLGFPFLPCSRMPMTIVLSLPPVPHFTSANVLVHIASLLTDEGFVGFTVAGEQPEPPSVRAKRKR